MSGRLIVVSNRIPGDGPPAGGLVFALHECLRRQGGIWVGSASETVETPSEQFHESEGDNYRKLTFELSEEDYAQYYLGYANSVLWPMFHRRIDLIDLQAENYEGYARVNARLARMLANELQPDDELWIHDYHFLPLAEELRGLGVENTIGCFLHIPFPNPSDLHALPQDDALAGWIAAYDLMGFQAQRDVAACLEFMRQSGIGVLQVDGRVRVGDRIVALRSFPIGIEAKSYAEVAATSAAADMLALPREARLVIGVDRLDYSKGLPNRVRAFGKYLEKNGDDAVHATLLQIAPESRSDVEAYQDLRAELEGLAGSVNGSYAKLDWTPIRYIRRQIPRDTLAGLYRRAQVGLVTPLADGMNLVAKEYVAAQDPEDPGVLILSSFAGAAEQMTEALIVNPYDVDEIADNIATALSMSLDERKTRHAALLKGVLEQDIHWWTRSYLDALSYVGRQGQASGSRPSGARQG